MSTAAGLALGLSLAELPIDIHAVRVSHTSIANPAVLAHLLRKTTAMLRNLDTSFPDNIAAIARIFLRDEYFGAGYAHSNALVDAAIATAADQFDIALESTYTGKAMAAMLCDLNTVDGRYARYLFWNTCHSQPLTESVDQPLDRSRLPEEFLRYFT